jgi:hypothetical protein
MRPRDRRHLLDLLAARYLDALERADVAEMEAVWSKAASDPELAEALREVHCGLLEEQAQASAATARAALTAAVETHLPSADIIRPAVGPVTVADVAEELFRHTPGRLPAEAHAVNDRLRSCREPLPEDLGLSRLTSWAEAKFGPAPPEYWRAFRQAAVNLELRWAAEAEYQLAARAGRGTGEPT